MYKRILSFFSALVICAGIALGSLSFMPRSSAFSPVKVNAIPNLSENEFYVSGVSNYGGTPHNVLIRVSITRFQSPISGRYNVGVNGKIIYISRCSVVLYEYNSDESGIYDLGSPVRSSTYDYYSSGSLVNIYSFYNTDTNCNVDYVDPSLVTSFSVDPFSWVLPDIPTPIYLDYSPFYFPELPYGYFDGHINSIDGTFDLDLGTLSGTSSDGGTYSLPSGLIGDYSGDNYTRVNTNDTSSGDIFLDSGITSTLSTSGTWSASDVEGDISYVPSFNETSRFRTWAVVSASSYVYFVCDTRNTITGFLESVNGSNGKLRFSAVGSDNVHYPFYAIEFAFDGTKIQNLTALPNGFTVDFVGGSIVTDSETNVISTDPLYHGVWLSSGSPPVNLSALSNDDYKWLANPVFGDKAFTLNFLNAINANITGLRSDLTSLQSAITGSISSQTSSFQNMDAPSNFDPTDVNNMLEYGSLESDFQAPSTDDIFSVDSGTFTDGMGFWRDRMNELLFFSGSPALPMTIFSLTLGLAVLIIGRRVSGGGAA